MPKVPAGLFRKPMSVAQQIMWGKQFTTPLAPDEEAQFQQWVQQNRVPWQDAPMADYDMRGYFQGLKSGDPIAVQSLNPSDGLMHFPDKWKTPFHSKFSNESKYATPDAPHWEGDNSSGWKLIDKSGKVIYDEAPQQQVK
jgi:hypothetical protein